MPQAPVPPLGRKQELELLLERWNLAREGAGQVVLLSAGAGLGKSRLVEILAQHTETEARALLRCRCSPRHRTQAYAPLRDLLRRLESVRDAGRTKENPADPANPEERQRATLIARLSTLLSHTRQPSATALNLNPEGQSKKTLEEILGLFLDSAKRHPVLLVIEDLEWVDPSTLELLSHLVNRKPNVRLMVVLTYSPAFEPPWSRRAYFSLLSLGRLSRQQQMSLIEQLTHDRPLTLALRQEIIARADGVPLYVEELVALAQSDDPPSPLPMTLKQWLSERLKRLGKAQKVAQLAAAFGEEVAYEPLRAIADLDESELRSTLDQLMEAGILKRTDPARRADFAFKHLLIRDAIHDSLLDEPRRETHRRIAEMLQRQPLEDGKQEHELIARHYAEAGMAREAMAAWRAAAEQAMNSSANLEAAQRAREGLAQLMSLPQNDQRTASETCFQILLGAALGTAKGYAFPAAQTAYDRALELVWQTPRNPELLPALQDLANYYLARGHVRTAREIAEEALRRIGGPQGDEALPAAHRMLGFALLLEGDFSRAETSLTQSLAPYAVHRSLLSATPPSLGIPLAEALSHLSLAQWFLGRPREALKHSTDSLTLARRFNDPFTRVFTVYRACFLHVFRREPAATRELAHELVELSNRHGFLFFIAAGMFLEGQALTAQDRAAEGLQMMSGGLDGVWASGLEVGRPRNLALLAEACGRSELVDQGLSLIKEGLAAVEITGERHYESELHRIQGELLRLAGAPEEEIEESQLQALALARRQVSISLELRAAISLGRLWRLQDKPRQARELLAAVYEKFTEGFDTADLKEAEELLDDLK